MKTFNFIKTAFILTVLFTAVSCSSDEVTNEDLYQGDTDVALATLTIEDFILSSEDHTILAQAIDRTGLIRQINNNTDLTVLLPNDIAMENFVNDLGFANVNEIPLETLNRTLANHVFALNDDVRDMNAGDEFLVSTLATTDYDDTINVDAIISRTTSGLEFNGQAIASSFNELENTNIMSISTVIRPATVLTLATTSREFTAVNDFILQSNFAQNVIDLCEREVSVQNPAITLFAPTAQAYQEFYDEMNDGDTTSSTGGALNQNLINSIINTQLSPDAHFVNTTLTNGLSIVTQGSPLTVGVDTAGDISLSGSPFALPAKVLQEEGKQLHAVNGTVLMIDRVMNF